MTSSPTWAPPPEFAAKLEVEYGLTCPPRWGTPRNFDRPTLGPKAAKVMEALGCKPMPWQRYVLDVALEIDPETGLLAYRKVGLSVPRQQGKTETCLTVMVHRCMAWPGQNVSYTAQTRIDARKRWEDEFLAKLDGSSLYGRYHPRKTTGNEAILFKATGSRLGIVSTTEKAGHGPPLDLGMIDEAFAHRDDRVEQSMSPAMLTRKNAQLWWASAGGTSDSLFLNAKRRTGREMVERAWRTGEWGSGAFFEWVAPEDMPRDDPKTWQACMPALGITCSEQSIRAELESMDEPEFDRAYLNRTRHPTPPDDLNVPKAAWPGCIDKASQPGVRLAFGVDVAPLRDHSSIAVASFRGDGRVHVELVDRRIGTAWIVPALVKLKALWSPVAIGLDAKSPAGSLLDELRAQGIGVPEQWDKPAHGDLAVPRAHEVAAACGQFADAVREGTIAHRDQAQLTAAVNGARTRSLSDAWAWHRRSAMVDISPLVAATLARWALLTREASVQPEYQNLDSVF